MSLLLLSPSSSSSSSIMITRCYRHRCVSTISSAATMVVSTRRRAARKMSTHHIIRYSSSSMITSSLSNHSVRRLHNHNHNHNRSTTYRNLSTSSLSSSLLLPAKTSTSISTSMTSSFNYCTFLDPHYSLHSSNSFRFNCNRRNSIRFVSSLSSMEDDEHHDTDHDDDHDDIDFDDYNMIIEEEVGGEEGGEVVDASSTSSSSSSSSKKKQEQKATTHNNTSESRKLSKKKKKRKRKAQPDDNDSFDVNFLHFRSNDSSGNEDDGTDASEIDDGNSLRTELEHEFDALAFQHDLNQFKWITVLEKRLTKSLADQQESYINENKDDLIRSLWKIALQATIGLQSKSQFRKKKATIIPTELRDHFLRRMIDQEGQDLVVDVDVESASASASKSASESASASASASESASASTSTSASASSLTSSTNDGNHHDCNKNENNNDHSDADVSLLLASRTIAANHPILWRRYSAKERKLRVKLSQSILQSTTDKTAGLATYLQGIRVPALQRIHNEEKTKDDLYREAQQLQQVLKERLPPPAYQQIIELVELHVDCFTMDENGQYGMDNDSNDTMDDDDVLKTNKKKKKTQKQFRVLLSNLRKIVPKGRLHWIGYEIAEFFYVTTPDAVDLLVASKNNQKLVDITPSHKVTAKYMVDDDPILKYSQLHYNEIRDQYIQSLLSISQLFLQLETENKKRKKMKLKNKNQADRKKHKKKGQHQQQDDETDTPTAAIDNSTYYDEDYDHCDEDHDPSSTQSVLNTYDKVKELIRNEKSKMPFSTQRMRARNYIPFEAMDVGHYWENQLLLVPGSDNDSNSSSVAALTNTNDVVQQQQQQQVFDNNSFLFPTEPPQDKLVLIDNLPIDITKERLEEVYRRCGAIDTIEIFNARPDLDPGRKQKIHIKKIRNTSSASSLQGSIRWERPRTPLYALILYKHTAGAVKAGSNPLRIFGMVVDSHLMRSYPAPDLDSLYLEDVLPTSSFGYDVTTIEYNLRQLLEPYHLYVCLDDVSSGDSDNYNHQRQPLSYKIKFPNFQATYLSYWKLKAEFELLQEKDNKDNNNGGIISSSSSTSTLPLLHWMATPNDANLYWTRKLNF